MHYLERHGYSDQFGTIPVEIGTQIAKLDIKTLLNKNMIMLLFMGDNIGSFSPQNFKIS